MAYKTVNGALETTLIPSSSDAELKSLLQTGLKLFQGPPAARGTDCEESEVKRLLLALGLVVAAAGSAPAVAPPCAGSPKSPRCRSRRRKIRSESVTSNG